MRTTDSIADVIQIYFDGLHAGSTSALPTYAEASTEARATRGTAS